MCPVFREFAEEALARKTAEIGMHLHAWNSPPIVPLTVDDYLHRPFLIECPNDVLREKVHVLTQLLREIFQVDVVSHRAGRWALDARYAAALVDEGYCVDCSVTPHISWQDMKGDPNGSGGSDYRSAPEVPYFVSSTDVNMVGDSPLLEVPMTIRPVRRAGWNRAFAEAAQHLPTPYGQRIGRRIFPAVRWLRPNGRNRGQMIRLLDEVADAGQGHAEFMLHSSEFMPGGSPRFPNKRSIERLYQDLEAVFEAAAKRFRGATLQEFHDGWVKRREARC